jgi:hypothetical protein
MPTTDNIVGTLSASRCRHDYHNISIAASFCLCCRRRSSPPISTTSARWQSILAFAANSPRRSSNSARSTATTRSLNISSFCKCFKHFGKATQSGDPSDSRRVLSALRTSATSSSAAPTAVYSQLMRQSSCWVEIFHIYISIRIDCVFGFDSCSVLFCSFIFLSIQMQLLALGRGVAQVVQRQRQQNACVGVAERVPFGTSRFHCDSRRRIQLEQETKACQIDRFDDVDRDVLASALAIPRIFLANALKQTRPVEYCASSQQVIVVRVLNVSDA